MNKKVSKGFTLIELLVVVAIISLLSSVVLAGLREARDRAKASAFQQQVNEFIKGIELYRTNNNGALPTEYIYMQDDFDEGAEIDGRDGDTPIPTAKQALKPYIDKFPKPPFRGGFGYVGGDDNSYNNPTCGTSRYYLQVEGSKNAEIFNHWISATERIYDIDFDMYKCYPLDN